MIWLHFFCQMLLTDFHIMFPCSTYYCSPFLTGSNLNARLILLILAEILMCSRFIVPICDTTKKEKKE